MGKYSSDSDSSGHKSRLRRKRRSLSSSPEDSRRSSHRSKKSSSSSRRDRHHKNSSRHKRSRSKSSRRSRSYSRERSKRRSRSYDKYKSKSKSYKSKTSSRRSSSNSDSSRSPSTARKYVPKTDNSAEELREKLLKSIKAADSADKKLKLLGAIPKNVKSRNDIDAMIPMPPSSDIIGEIENDSFQPKMFISSKHAVTSDTKTEVNEVVPPTDKSLHSSIFDDQKAKLNRWVKKLFQIRQRALMEGSLNK